ncbi:MAG: glucoamylase family protein [Phycisphaerales bacterium]
MSSENEPAPILDASKVVIDIPPGTPTPPFAFSPEDEALLDEIQHAAFLFFWNAVSEQTGMVFDRTGGDLVSVAGVGFQLSALAVGVERGWITRDQGYERALKIVTSLQDQPGNRHEGLFFHFLDPSGVPHPRAYEHVVSTIDSAILFAGLLTASAYFGDDVAAGADRLFAEANWAAFLAPASEHPAYRGFVSLGWKADDPRHPEAGGKLLPTYWADAGGEHRLITFLGACAPRDDRRLGPQYYYRLRRPLGQYRTIGPMFCFPYSGALFTSITDNCWIDYRSLAPDDPSSFGFGQRARINWWEDARRHVLMHRAKAIENPLGLRTPGPHAWGLSASDGPDGYCVSHIYPDRIPMPNAREDFDIPPATHAYVEQWNSGVIAPYSAGSAVMFEPRLALDALRFYRSLSGPDGRLLVWRSPSDGGYGFLDAYTLDTPSGTPWVASDYVAIDQGPLILGIENARSGLIWELFRSHPAVGAGMGRLGLVRRGEPKKSD